MSALITWQNIVDDVTPVATDSHVSFPPANLQKRGLGDVYRSSAVTSVTLSVDNRNAYYGAVDEEFCSRVYLNNTVYAIAKDSAGGFLVAGLFTSASGTNPKRIARFHANGDPDITFNGVVNSSGPDSTVRDLVIHDDGSIVFVGDFTSSGGTTRNRIARLNPNGSLDSGFNPNANGVVYAIQKLGSGYIIGGDFTVVSGSSAQRLTTINAAGSGVPAWAGGAVNGSVRALVVQPDGKILVGGDFTTARGASRVGLARIDGAGTLDAGFVANANNTVLAITLQPDGKILVGGSFTTINGLMATRLARLNPDGTLDAGFSAAANLTVHSIKVLPDSSILCGGSFTTINGVAVNRMARLNPDGSLRADSPSANGTVYALHADDVDVLAGGDFAKVDDVSASRFARMDPYREPSRASVVALLGLRTKNGIVTLKWRRPGMVSHDAKQITIELRGQTEIIQELPPDIPLNSQFDIDWQNGVADVFSLARLWIGPALELPNGIDAAWSMSFADTGTLEASEGQQFYARTGVRQRLLSLSLTGIDTKTAWGMSDADLAISTYNNLHQLQLDAGTTGEVIVIPRTQTPAWIRRVSLYGHITREWSIEHQAGPNWRASFTVAEEL